MADLATLQTWLSEAESARHQLALGQSLVEVARDGRKMVYSRAKASELDAYIAELNRLISVERDRLNGTCHARRRSIGVVWGG